MVSKKEGRRVILNDKALSEVNKAIRELRRRHCKVSHSALVSVALEIFFEKYFLKEVKQFEMSFFNQKSYLKSVLDSERSPEEIINSLRNLTRKQSTKSLKLE